MNAITRFLASPVDRRYKTILARLTNLESAVKAMVDEPEYVAKPDAGFNGQHVRKRIFEELLHEVSFDVIVETGTWLGDTTGYMAGASSLPVFSSDVDELLHSVAKRRLLGIDSVTLQLSDSRAFLVDVAEEGFNERTTFFYLDAHWYADLPLAEELAIIAARWSSFVIMIDDFRVPGDPGYGFDDYGSGKSLELRDFGDLFDRLDLRAYFPSAPSSDESGRQRGCVVLAGGDAAASALSRVASLTAHGPS